jgi:hypothetical protein
MEGIHKFSHKVIDYAERLSDVADAAQGKRRSGHGMVRRLVLPASGAALLALVRSDFFTRQAKDAIKDAKALASDLPDDLMATVRQSASGSAAKGGSKPTATRRSGSSSGSRRTSRPRKRTTASRKRTSAAR